MAEAHDILQSNRGLRRLKQYVSHCSFVSIPGNTSQWQEMAARLLPAVLVLRQRIEEIVHPGSTANLLHWIAGKRIYRQNVARSEFV